MGSPLLRSEYAPLVMGAASVQPYSLGRSGSGSGSGSRSGLYYESVDTSKKPSWRASMPVLTLVKVWAADRSERIANKSHLAALAETVLQTSAFPSFGYHQTESVDFAARFSIVNCAAGKSSLDGR
jgi:hypothetical protein